MNTIAERVGTTARDYLFAPGIDEPLAKYAAGALTYYSVDGLGSVVAETDGSGAVVNTAAYDAWGIPQQAGSIGLFGYTGRESTGSGLWFLRARYYNPFTGRFLSEDGYPRPAQSAYAYANNDPVLLNDPLGFDAGLPQGAIQCISRAGDVYVRARFLCYATRAVQMSDIARRLAECLFFHTRLPRVCVENAKTEVENAKQQYAVCLADASYDYVEAIRKCRCQNDAGGSGCGGHLFGGRL